MEETKKYEGFEASNIDTEYGGVYFIALLLKYKWFVITIVFLSTLGSVVLSLNMPNWYSSTVNAVPSKTQGSLFEGMLGGLSSALKDFGLTKLGGKGGEAYDFIVIMQSRVLKDSLIEKFNLAEEYDIPDSLRTKIYNELEDNLEITYEKEGNYTLTVTSKDKYKSLEMVNYSLNLINTLAYRVAQKEASTNREYLELRIRQTDSTISSVADSLTIYSKKYFLFSLEDQATAISKAYAELKSELIKQETILVFIQNKYGENDTYTTQRKKIISKLESQLEKAKNEPGFGGDFALKDATGVGIEYMRLLAEFEVFTKVKSFLMPMLEEAKLKESRKTKSLIVIDPPRLADKKSRPKRSLIVIGFFIGSFALCSMLIVFIDGYKNLKRKLKKLK